MLKEGDKYYNDINKILNDLPVDFNILEEQIDIEDQVRYFEFSRKLREKGFDPGLLEDSNELFTKETGIERKKEILTCLALTVDVKAYRTIEKFLEKAGPEIRSWAVMALQESRMMLKSSLLDEKQIFISTGLGGKGQKLRYYAIFINRSSDIILNPVQQKVLKNELLIALDKEKGEFESIDFSGGFSGALLLLQIKTDIKEFFRDIIEECNQYGNFLDEDMIITNVKVLSRNEIVTYLEQKDKGDDEGSGVEEE
jgi:hypothetical protein